MKYSQIRNFFKKPFVFISDFLEVYRWPLVSGFFFGMAFIPYPLITTFFALVPLWFFIFKEKSLKRIIVAALCCQFIATTVGFHWIIYTAQAFGNLNLFFSLIVFSGFLLIGNIYILLASTLSFFFLRKFSHLPIFIKLLIFPLSFSFLHFYIPTIFPWNMGYHLLWQGFPALQTAEIWGFRFLDTLFYMFMLGSMIVCYHTKLFLRTSPSFKWSLKLDKIGVLFLSVLVLSFIFLNLYGVFLKKRLPPPDASLKVILVQNNIGAIYKQKRRNPQKHAFFKTRSLTKKALRHVRLKSNVSKEEIDFILWSEGTYPFPIPKENERARYLSSLSQSLQVPIITGTTTVNEDDQVFNSLVISDRQGQILKPHYDKLKLLIFGEYFPGLELFPFLRKLVPYFGGSLTHGKDLVIQELEGVNLASQICYEGLFDHLSRKLALKKAHVFINVSNDSWYNSYQPQQHLTMNLTRAIETRRPMIRNTNTGLSTVIYADGTIKEISPRDRSWYKFYEVPYYKNPKKTFFLSLGYYTNDLFYILLSLFIGFFIFKGRKNS